VHQRSTSHTNLSGNVHLLDSSPSMVSTSEELGAAAALGVGGEPPLSYPRHRSWCRRERSRGGGGMGTRFLCLFLFIPFVLSLASFTSLGKAWAEGKRGACNVPPPRGQRTGELRKMYAAMIYKSRMRVTMNKKKKILPVPLPLHPLLHTQATRLREYGIDYHSGPAPFWSSYDNPRSHQTGGLLLAAMAIV